MTKRASMYRRLIMPMVVLVTLGAIGTACASGPAANTPVPATSSAPPSTGLDGEALTKERCVGCHDLSRVETARKGEADWASTVQRMVDKGTRLSAEEQEAVVEYLAAIYPK